MMKLRPINPTFHRKVISFPSIYFSEKKGEKKMCVYKFYLTFILFICY